MSDVENHVNDEPYTVSDVFLELLEYKSIYCYLEFRSAENQDMVMDGSLECTEFKAMGKGSIRFYDSISSSFQCQFSLKEKVNVFCNADELVSDSPFPHSRKKLIGYAWETEIGITDINGNNIKLSFEGEDDEVAFRTEEEYQEQKDIFLGNIEPNYMKIPDYIDFDNIEWRD